MTRKSILAQHMAVVRNVNASAEGKLVLKPHRHNRPLSSNRGSSSSSSSLALNPGGSKLASRHTLCLLLTLQVTTSIHGFPFQLTDLTGEGKTFDMCTGLRGMSATRQLDKGESIVVLPRTAALLVTPKMKCPFPDMVTQEFWSKSQWY